MARTAHIIHFPAQAGGFVGRTRIPERKPDEFIVTVCGHGELCRHFTDALEAIAYQRSLNRRLDPLASC